MAGVEKSKAAENEDVFLKGWITFFAGTTYEFADCSSRLMPPSLS
jgi:hypothetical protein